MESNHPDKSSSKYVHKPTSLIYHAKQVVKINSDGEVRFNDGKSEVLPKDEVGSFIEGTEGHQRLVTADWLLTSEMGLRRVVQAGTFNREFIHYFENQ